ncbi:hypothetical protein C5749_05670 [Sphingobacterium gobiense]|uniref:Uncharacterized protein n=1 Tax=Sphingobacterium gobiense TaxID=1382456 RepID=A0A2S9JU01_9SPHI|nr:hypothetical protein C5749_05670 [Sphingobacterium gobiense]
MKYFKEIFGTCILLCVIVFIDAYKERTRQQRFQYITVERSTTIFDSKTLKSYMQLPDKDRNIYLYEYSDFIKNGTSAKKYRPLQLLDQ